MKLSVVLRDSCGAGNRAVGSCMQSLLSPLNLSPAPGFDLLLLSR